MTLPYLENGLNHLDILPGSASLCWLLSNLIKENDGFITNISVIQTWRWFFALTPFESVFLGMIMMQITALQIIGVIPINVNQFIHGASSGKKKREAKLSKCKDQENDLTEKILSVLHRVDQYGCILLTLCETQKQRDLGVKLPDSLLFTLSTLSSANRCINVQHLGSTLPGSSKNGTETQKFLPVYQDAVDLGQEAAILSRNSTLCSDRYSKCPLGVEDILDYVHQIKLDDMYY